MSHQVIGRVFSVGHRGLGLANLMGRLVSGITIFLLQNSLISIGKTLMCSQSLSASSAFGLTGESMDFELMSQTH